MLIVEAMSVVVCTAALWGGEGRGGEGRGGEGMCSTLPYCFTPLHRPRPQQLQALERLLVLMQRYITMVEVSCHDNYLCIFVNELLFCVGSGGK